MGLKLVPVTRRRVNRWRWLLILLLLLVGILVFRRCIKCPSCTIQTSLECLWDADPGTGEDSKWKVKYKNLMDIVGKKEPLLEDITIVTAYFNIGSFAKGEDGQVYNTRFYKSWMKVFGRITNPVIAFFDDEQIEKHFHEVRSHLPESKTRSSVIARKDLWAFGLKPNISKIIRQEKYPKYYPNTVIPEYSCIMHAKYELMAVVTAQNPFHTRYFAWLDIGLFRQLNHRDPTPFKLGLPPQFDRSKVAYTQVEPMWNFTVRQIFMDNMVWVCGCFFLADHKVMSEWVRHYTSTVERFLAMGLSNTDQQVLYAMFAEGQPRPLVDVQTYVAKGRAYNRWFYLGYLSKEAGERS